MSMGLKPAAVAAATSLWGMFSEFVTPCYYFTPGPMNRGTMECIIRPVPGRYVDGADVKAGDSQVFCTTGSEGLVYLSMSSKYY